MIDLDAVIYSIWTIQILTNLMKYKLTKLLMKAFFHFALMVVYTETNQDLLIIHAILTLELLIWLLNVIHKHSILLDYFQLFVFMQKNQFKTQRIVHCCSPPDYDEEEKETQTDEHGRQSIFKVKPVLNY
jgi:hypothetical protein